LISSGEALLKTDLKYFHREYDNTSNLGNKWNLIVQVYVVKNMINTIWGHEINVFNKSNEQCCGNGSMFACGSGPVKHFIGLQNA